MSEDQLFDRATGKSRFAALWSPALIEVWNKSYLVI